MDDERERELPYDHPDAVSIVDPYFRLDARVEKAFGKAWMVFLDGRDLLDRPIGNGIISDIEQQNWYEETRSNRRLVQVGVTYQF